MSGRGGCRGDGRAVPEVGLSSKCCPGSARKEDGEGKERPQKPLFLSPSVLIVS